MNKLQIGKMPQLPFEVSEAINQLRINLSFCGSDVKTIMITSSTPNEGKSFVTMQLWRMIAELGTPAVLIDCDFRKSEMRSKYGMSTSGQLIGGVQGVLLGEVGSHPDLIFPVDPGHDAAVVLLCLLRRGCLRR